MSARVSLALPVYNGERYVAQAIAAVLAQDFDDFEFIISDNASTDRTQEICRSFAAADPRIRYYRNQTNIGAAGNYNRGFELARGEYFKWCAHDDCISANYLRECVRALDQDASAVAAYGRLRYIDDTGKVIPRDRGEPDVSVFERLFPDMRGLSAARRYRMLIHAGGSDNVMFGLFRSSALSRSSLHRKYYMSDRALLVELVMQGTFLHVPQVTLFNRDHADRSTRLADKLTRTLWTNPEASERYCFEHLSLLGQHFETAWGARKVAPLPLTVGALGLWALQPMRLGGCALELIGMLSPSLRYRLGRLAWWIVHTVRGAGRFRAAAGATHD
jgi:glycosyltransferase involved in cell wall biosynthesis